MPFRLSYFFAAVSVALAVAVLHYKAESARFEREAAALEESISLQSVLFEAERAKAAERQARYKLREGEIAEEASAARERLRRELKRNNSCERELELVEEELGRILLGVPSKKGEL